jgi:hypothetical protein
MLDEGVIYRHPERQEEAIVYSKDEASIRTFSIITTAEAGTGFKCSSYNPLSEKRSFARRP